MENSWVAEQLAAFKGELNWMELVGSSVTKMYNDV
jgi:hypothetical protein